ncbi:MAG: protein-L-isoaspartate(D-aspartate) O-methyltransferase [Candidatus Micrarchaeota archaeon]|nr:protein-L-isoaspartate(D-aspartate) O-methyltransferase [Candidatus Micrarchaeota archaeon]
MRTNEELVRELLQIGVAAPEVAAAMLKYPREKFLPQEEAASAYYDLPVPIGNGQTCSAPSMVATMLSLLSPRKGDNVLEIGTGCAWQTALISDLVGEDGHVVSVERLAEFSKQAAERFSSLGIKNTKFITGDGKLGYAAEAPYDRIIVGAACDKVYPAWETQMRDGGIIILPMGDIFQWLFKGVKRNGHVEATRLMPVQFVKLI